MSRTMTNGHPHMSTEGTRIEVRDLTKRFGTFTAVDDLSFSVEPGRITGFLGPNGAGKTTTLRMLLGPGAPHLGTATIGGQRYADIAAPAAPSWARRWRRRTSTPAAPGATTCASSPTRPASAPPRVDEMLELVGIPAAARKRAGGYSMGMRQRLGLAARPAGRPPGAHPRRAGQRAGPRGHPVAARVPAPPRPPRARPS